MKALLLAAGRGTRISRYLAGNPKCTVDIGGKSLIEYTIDLLKSSGVSDIALCLGYRQEVIKDLLKDKGVKFYYNPFFDVTNSIASTWFAKDFLEGGDDVIIMNADVFMEKALMDLVIKDDKSPVMYADESRKEEADYKFFYENNILKKYGKELQDDDITGEYVGIAKIGSNYINRFIKNLEKMIGDQKHSVWWENVLYEDTKNTDIYVRNVQSLFWAEVDYVEDYERILQFLGYKLDFKLNVHR